jgi:hypothetical protein
MSLQETDYFLNFHALASGQRKNGQESLPLPSLTATLSALRAFRDSDRYKGLVLPPVQQLQRYAKVEDSTSISRESVYKCVTTWKKGRKNSEAESFKHTKI